MFEYLILTWHSGIEIHRSVDSEKIKARNYGDVVKALNDLGKNGWEVCGASPGALGMMVWTLKRKI